MRYALILIAILLVSCTPIIETAVVEDDCQARCSSIEAAPNVPYTFEERGAGLDCYYGGLNQKMPGTPDDWVHVKEGTRSAAWCGPNPEILAECDC